jgi:hypothetical protein
MEVEKSQNPLGDTPHLWVVHDAVCAHCKTNLGKERLVFCVGEPFHCIMHKECAPFFDYDTGWPHKKPMSAYKKFK